MVRVRTLLIVSAVALDPEGRIVVAGVAYKSGGSDFALAR